MNMKKVLEAARKQATNVEDMEGGNFINEPYAAGKCGVRMVGYVELGQHAETFEGVKKTPDQVLTIFELSGKIRNEEGKLVDKFPEVKTENGVFYPTISLRFNKSASDKGWYKKHFRKLTETSMHSGIHESYPDFIGEGWTGEITHTKSQDGKKTYANIRKKGEPVSVECLEYEDPETLEKRVRKVPEMKSSPIVFLWDASPEIIGEMWQTLAPWHKELIKKAVNYEGSNIHAYLEGLEDGEDDYDDSEEEPEEGSKPRKSVEWDDMDDDIPF